MTNIVVWSAVRTSADAVSAQFPGDRVIGIADEKGLGAAADAEVAFSGNNPRRVRQLLDATPKLRWYHTVSAGVENMPLSELAQRGIVLTNNSGSYDVQIAEHLMMFVFAASRQLHRYRDQQRSRVWKDLSHQELRDATIVIYGMGSIGGEVARLARAVGMRVIGVRRKAASREPGVERVVAAEQLADVVGEADYLAITSSTASITRRGTDAGRAPVRRPEDRRVHRIGHPRDDATLCDPRRYQPRPGLSEFPRAASGEGGRKARDRRGHQPVRDHVGVEEPSRRPRSYVPRALRDGSGSGDDADRHLRIDGGDDLHAPGYLRPR